jgi:hypothetical protein
VRRIFSNGLPTTKLTDEETEYFDRWVGSISLAKVDNTLMPLSFTRTLRFKVRLKGGLVLRSLGLTHADGEVRVR